MSEMYPTPQSFDRTLKKACAKAGGDSGELYRMMLRGSRFVESKFRCICKEERRACWVRNI